MLSTNISPIIGESDLSNGVAQTTSYDFKLVSGIDSLYYFVPSNESYKEFYISILNTIDITKEANNGYIPKETLKIKISEIEFTYLGKQEGFHFFRDDNGLFRIGFKDPLTNLNVHDIRVQLQGVGIYGFGLMPLTEYINSTIIKHISQPFYYVTRVDFNVFCQYDLGLVIKSEHIVTRKRRFSQIIGTKNRYETLYIGTAPSRFRIYNKYLEMTHGLETLKTFFLRKYLEEHGIEIKDPFWNFEIECHREFLKQFKLSTLEDLFSNTESLFHKCMQMVRLIDISTVSDKAIKANRLHKAHTHPLWNYIDKSYTFNAYKQNKIPLQRLTYSPKEYKTSDFMDELDVLITKGKEHNIMLNHDDIRDIFHKSNLNLTARARIDVKPFIPILLKTSNRKYLLTRNHTAVPTLPKNLESQPDEELNILSELLTKALHKEFGHRYPDMSLITKHIEPIEIEKHRRKVGQKELELWQQ
jgi:hypothetical protein